MSEELKPCPFCGCPFAGISWPIVQSVRLSVKCPSCHSHGGYGNTEAEAAEAWNTRTRTDPMKELCEALEKICAEADKIRQLPPSDSFRDGLVEGLSWARTIARTALENAKGGGR